MKKTLELLLGLVRLPIDYLLTIAAFLLAFKIRLNTDLIPGIQLPVTPSVFPEFNEYFLTSSIAAAFLIMIFLASDLYNLKRPENLSHQIYKIFTCSLIWLLGIITYYFLIRAFPFSRLALIQTWLFTFTLVSLGHVLMQGLQNCLYRKGISQTRVLLIGATPTAHELLKIYFQNPQYLCLGYLDDRDEKLENLKYLGNLHQLEDIVKEYQVDKIIQTKEHFSDLQEGNILKFCRESQLEYSFIPSQLEMQTSNVDIETVDGIPIISLKPTPLDGWGRVFKRTFDFVGSLLLLLILWPVLLIIAILIKLDDPKGTILFSHLDDGTRVKRVGQKGKLFNFLKFRTMIPNSHNLRYTQLAHLNSREGTPMVKIKNDPRITKIGRFLRKTSLDELPQLFNVLMGDMSLVGPRPHLPEEVASYKNHHKFVFTIKPGITGLAQISGRSDLDFEREIKLDTYYIENWSILSDLKILFKTIFVVFKKYEE